MVPLEINGNRRLHPFSFITIIYWKSSKIKLHWISNHRKVFLNHLSKKRYLNRSLIQKITKPIAIPPIPIPIPYFQKILYTSNWIFKLSNWIFNLSNSIFCSFFFFLRLLKFSVHVAISLSFFFESLQFLLFSLKLFINKSLLLIRSRGFLAWFPLSCVFKSFNG